MLYDIDYHKLRPVIKPWNSRRLSGQAAADNHHGALLMVFAASVLWKEALIRGVKPVEDTGNADLSAMRMP